MGVQPAMNLVVAGGADPGAVARVVQVGVAGSACPSADVVRLYRRSWEVVAASLAAVMRLAPCAKSLGRTGLALLAFAYAVKSRAGQGDLATAQRRATELRGATLEGASLQAVVAGSMLGRTCIFRVRKKLACSG